MAGRPRTLSLWPVLLMAAVAAALAGFLAYSAARVRIPYGIFQHPPLYGFWRPELPSSALLMIPAGLLLTGVAVLVTSVRLPTWAALVLVIAAGTVTAAAADLIRGDPSHLVRGLSEGLVEHRYYYPADQHFVRELGIRGFVAQQPHLVHLFRAYNSRTHPAGIHLLLNGLFQGLGPHPLRIATAVAAIGMTAAAGAWAMGRTLGGERAGRIAAVLFAAAPGPLLLAYTIMDAVYATVMSAAAALLMVAIHRRSARLAAAGGAVLGVSALLTYATVFLVLGAVAAVLIQLPGPRAALRLLAAAALGGAAVLAAARITLGFDLLAQYRAAPPSGRHWTPYWLAGAPAAWLVCAGLPIAALGVLGLVRRFPPARAAVLPAAVVLIMVVWAALPSSVTRLRPGEVERTWAFLYPMLAATAGVVVAHWTRAASRRTAALVVAGLVALSLLQTTAIQALWDNFL
ncbi:glycosyltransferase family 39 protein [Catellatospora sp. TT07R-123]|uniref:glycosyltransferase family 39 protein n=1 Tax=Catellatospora sp. TT07R-123 TaxID=2733863 RepID=UPI001BB43333|nr:glycosyltransferase family 39 protein [Catellatospora sp. TT07R-123]